MKGSFDNPQFGEAFALGFIIVEITEGVVVLQETKIRRVVWTT